MSIILALAKSLVAAAMRVVRPIIFSVKKISSLQLLQVAEAHIIAARAQQKAPFAAEAASEPVKRRQDPERRREIGKKQAMMFRYSDLDVPESVATHLGGLVSGLCRG